MTQRDMAGFLGVTPMTLRNWKKDKPNLYKIVLLGFAFERTLQKTQEHTKELEALKEELLKGL